MKEAKSILQWFFGIFCIVCGLIFLSEMPMTAIFSMLFGLFFIPQSRKLIEKQINFNFPSVLKWVIAICGFIFITNGATRLIDIQAQSKDKLILEASSLIDNGDIESAKKILVDIKLNYNLTEIKEAQLLELEIENSQSVYFAREQIYKLSDDEFKELELENFNKTILNQKTLNQNLITLMQSQSDQREEIIKLYTEKEKNDKILSEEKRKQELQGQRNELIKKQFNSWNGSHRGLSAYIKENMNDPSSYEHMETKYFDQGSTLLIITKFRGNNAFGGKVINTVSAKVDLNGKVLEIVSQN